MEAEHKLASNRKNRRILIGSIVVFVVFVVAILFLRFFIFGEEDNWIKDARGVYVKHGNPSNTPSEVKKQQEIIHAAGQLYATKKVVGMQFSSQCLGTAEDYAVDIVHVPRTMEDDLLQNQCEEFKSGKVSHFIELDKEGNVVRIV